LLKNYFKIAIRNLIKHKFFSMLNIAGLAIGMAACLLIFNYVQYEKSYDRFWKNSGRIYRIRHDKFQNGSLQYKNAQTFLGLGPIIRQELPEVENQVRMFKDVVTAYTPDTQLRDADMFWTDSTFLKIFDRPFVSGTGARLFSDMYSAVISQSAARTLYGDADPIGRYFKLNQGWEFYVAGVFTDLPQNSHFRADILIGMPAVYYYMSNFDDRTGKLSHKNPLAYLEPPASAQGQWESNNVYTYILTRPNVDIAALEKKINSLVEKYTQHFIKTGGSTAIILQPIKDIHLNSHLDYEIRPNGDRNSINVLGMIAIVVLVIAWINFVNLTMVRSIERMKETGLRKVIGAGRSQLIFQFVLESVFLNISSIVVAVLIVIFTKNAFHTLTGLTALTFGIVRFQAWFMLGSFFLCGVFLSALYPSLLLSSYQPVSLLKKTVMGTSRGLFVRKFLVVAQFTASIILLISTITIYRQVDFMRRQNLGVDITQMLVTYSPMNMISKPNLMEKLITYKTEIQSLPHVISIATSMSIPGKEIPLHREDVRNINNMEKSTASFSTVNIDHDFIKTYDLKLMSGRNFEQTANANTCKVIINQSAVKSLGFKDVHEAIAGFLQEGDQQYQIIGVIEDYHHESLKKAIEPIIFHFSYHWNLDVGYYSIKIEPTDVRRTIAEIKAVWDRIYPDEPFFYFFLDDAFNAQYKADEQFGKIFGIFSILAVFVACLGLLGLTVYAVEQRTKEIGVRKVLGSSVIGIVTLLSKDFLKSVLLANLIAWPVAWFIMNRWLQNFAYRTNTSWWIFALAGLFVILIAILTTSYQAVKTAMKNPVEVLRYE
jgi:putative ABC transport system permease protein